jgi:hypothetical protein
VRDIPKSGTRPLENAFLPKAGHGFVFVSAVDVLPNSRTNAKALGQLARLRERSHVPGMPFLKVRSEDGVINSVPVDSHQQSPEADNPPHDLSANC